MDKYRTLDLLQLLSKQNCYEANGTSYVVPKDRDTAAQLTYTLFATNLATYALWKTVSNSFPSRKDTNRLNTHRTSLVNDTAVSHPANAQTVR